MALTTNLKRTGRAAVIERMDFLTEIQEANERVLDRCGEAMELLRDADPEWEAWYDTCIPDNASYEQITDMVNEHIEHLAQEADYADLKQTEACARI